VKVFKFIIFFFASLCIIAFLLPKEIEVTRSIEIAASESEVFEQINTFKNWENFSVWHLMDTTATFTYSEQESGKDSWHTWQGELIGEGKYTITESIPYKSIKTELDFYEQGNGKEEWTLTYKGQSTIVSVTNFVDLGFNPLARWIGLTMDNMLGSSLELSLQNLSDYFDNQEDLIEIVIN
jgi:hypothetical protein